MADVKRTPDVVEGEIVALKARLASNNSDIGDYRMIKTVEAHLLDEEDPYDTASLIAQRKAARKEINELTEEYNNLVAQGVTSEE